MTPTFRSGQSARTLMNNTDMSAIMQNVTVEASVNALDVTHHQQSDKNYIAGLRDGTVSFEGLYDGTAGSTASTASTGAIDAKFASALGASTQPIFTVFPEGDTLGRRARLFRAEQTAYTASAMSDDVVKVSAAAQISGRQDYGVSLLALSTRSSTSSTLGNVNHGAQTTGGGVGHLHYTAGSLAGMTVKIQHSSADTTGSTDAWADIISFTAVTETSAVATAVQRTTVSGTIKERARAIISAYSTASGNTTAGTVAVAFARRKHPLT